MKKLVLTALTTALCSLSIVASLVAPSIAQPATPPAASANPQAQIIEQLKITKEQQCRQLSLIPRYLTVRYLYRLFLAINE